MAGIRTFIAVHTPDEIRTEMARLQRELKQSGADVKWESPEKFHATVKFLGDVETETLPTVISTIEAAVQSHPPFDLTYEKVGAFPTTRRPRVIWIGCSNPDGTLLRVKDAFDRELLRYGFDIEERAFHPHVTLGRAKSSHGLADLTRTLESCTFDARSTTINGIYIMKSVLKPQGAEYTVLREVRLAAQQHA